jgi:hypothetical protein
LQRWLSAVSGNGLNGLLENRAKVRTNTVIQRGGEDGWQTSRWMDVYFWGVFYFNLIVKIKKIYYCHFICMILYYLMFYGDRLWHYTQVQQWLAETLNVEAEVGPPASSVRYRCWCAKLKSRPSCGMFKQNPAATCGL